MNDTPMAPVRRFKCPSCGTNFHIKRSINGHYVRFMPPKYCPGCGEPVKEGSCSR